MPKDLFNIAVIGAGGIGADHIQSFQQHPSARVVAIAEVNAERGEEAAEKFGVPTLVADYRDLLKRPDIDVVSIALPNYLHAPVALAALKAGKHVMLDKPIATNAADAAKVVNEARKQGLLFMVGQNGRFIVETQTAKQLIAKHGRG
jgi:predicted dehydrogenase